MPSFASLASVSRQSRSISRGAIRLASAQPDREEGLEIVRLVARKRAQVLAEARFDQGFPQRTGGAPDEGVGEHGEEEHYIGPRVRFEHPGEVDVGPAGARLVAADRVFHVGLPWRSPPRLLSHARVELDLGRVGDPLGDEGQVVFERDVAVEEPGSVARGVVPAVELQEGFVFQVGDGIGVAAGIEAVAVVWERVPLELAPDQGVSVGIGALHLVVDDSGDAQRRWSLARLLELEMAALAQEGPLREQGMEDEIGVHGGEVEVVRSHGGADGVDGLVGIREGVEVGRERSLAEPGEGVLHRILFRAGED